MHRIQTTSKYTLHNKEEENYALAGFAPHARVYTHAWWFVPEAPSPSASSPAGRLVLLRPQTLHFISQACCLAPRLLDGGASIAPRGTRARP